ncbi:hypothetical protein VTK26DRAFT_1260 [Humicola hyalothermophila]
MGPLWILGVAPHTQPGYSPSSAVACRVLAAYGYLAAWLQAVCLYRFSRTLIGPFPDRAFPRGSRTAQGLPASCTRPGPSLTY